MAAQPGNCEQHSSVGWTLTAAQGMRNPGHCELHSFVSSSTTAAEAREAKSHKSQKPTEATKSQQRSHQEPTKKQKQKTKSHQKPKATRHSFIQGGIFPWDMYFLCGLWDIVWLSWRKEGRKEWRKKHNGKHAKQKK